MYNIYCDESCHLKMTENNKNEQQSMVIGGITINKDMVQEVSENIRRIKTKHGINRSEVKWTKVCPSKIDFYKELIEYYFSKPELGFRCIVSQDKSKLRYDTHTHDEIYYIMYFYLLREMISIEDENSIYVDKKDTHGGEKVKKLKECLCNQKLDFNQNLITKIQIISSKDSEIMQLADILIGAVSYANRMLDKDDEGKKSNAKTEIINLIREKSKKSLLHTTPVKEYKFNIFIFGRDSYFN